MKELKSNLTCGRSWQRLLFMLFFGLAYSVAELVVLLVAAVQFVSLIFTGGTNGRLLRLGQGLSCYIYQIMAFLTFNREERPYPFAPWPGDTCREEAASSGQH